MNKLGLVKLREAMGRAPCKKHKDVCPIPQNGKLKPCQWGHTALEFSEHCDDCGVIVLKGLKTYHFAQRFHHSKERYARRKRGTGM